VKKTFCFLVLLGFLFVSSTSVAEFQTDVEMGYFTDFVGGAGPLIHDGSVFQQSVTLSWWNTSFKIWNSISPKGGANNDFGDEFDLMVSNNAINIGPVNLDVGIAYFDLYDIREIEGDLFAVYTTVSWSKLFLYVEGDIPQDKDILEGGMLYKFGVNHDFLEETKFTFHSCLSIAGKDGLERVEYTRLVLNKNFKTKFGIFTPSFSSQTNLGNDNAGAAKNKVWGGLKWSKTF